MPSTNPSLLALALVAFLLSATAADAAFDPELLHGSTLTSTRYVDLALDANDDPHVAWSGGAVIQYATRAGGDWTFLTHNVGPDNLYCALDVDDAGDAHFALRAGTYPLQFLMYVSYSNGFWTSQFPDMPGGAPGDTLSGDWPDIVVNAAGDPFISYRRLNTGSADGDLYLASRSGGVWTVEPVHTGPDDVGSHSSIVLGPGGRPRIAYRDETNDNLMVARKTALDTWILETVDDLPDVGVGADIAIDADGVPHVSYIDQVAHAVRYAHRTGGAWSTEQIPDGAQTLAEGTSIAVDSLGEPHIVYFSTDAGKCRHVTKSGGAWQSEAVDENGDRGWRPSLALAADDTPHTAYLELPSQDVWYATVAVDVGVATPDPAFASLLKVFPNPAVGGMPVRIEFGDAEGKLGGAPADVGVYDLAGRRVRTLAAGGAASGVVTWDGRTDAGTDAGRGAYVVRYRQGARSTSKQVLLMP